MILAGDVGVLRLQEQIGARNNALIVSGVESLTDGRLVIMAALIRRIHGAEAGAQREDGESGCALLFPRGAVDKIRSVWRHIQSVQMMAQSGRASQLDSALMSGKQCADPGT